VDIIYGELKIPSTSVIRRDIKKSLIDGVNWAEKVATNKHKTRDFYIFKRALIGASLWKIMKRNSVAKFWNITETASRARWKWL
jgi:hypothetical protein